MFRGQRIRQIIIVWDVTGKEDYRRLHLMYYNGAEGVIAVGDASLPQSVESMPHWIGAPVYLVNTESTSKAALKMPYYELAKSIIMNTDASSG